MELNGRTLQGVGRGITLDHIHVHKAEDDCFEFFGGTVDGKYLMCTDGHDDGFDFVEGWRGRAQFLIARMRQTNAELNRDSNGIEGSNANGSTSDFDAPPRSNPTLYNVTLRRSQTRLRIGRPGRRWLDIGADAGGWVLHQDEFHRGKRTYP